MVGYAFDLDMINASHGKKSLLISCSSPDAGIDTSMPGTVTNYFPILIEGTQKVKIKIGVDIRTENISKGTANFEAVSLSSAGNPIVYLNLTKDSIRGSLDWKRYYIAFDCDSSATMVAIACELNGNGKAWFDNIVITVNGEKYPESPLVIPELSKIEKEDLAKYIIPLNLKSSTADGDLKKLDPVFEGHRVIGLGEATHGTHEFQEAKIKIIKYLIAKKGFTHFALEANVAETELINEYVHTGNGNLDTLMKGLHFWCWMSEEMKGLVNWIKDYNASSGKNIQFIGIDMQFVDFPAKQIAEFVTTYQLANADKISALCGEYISASHRLTGGEYKAMQILAMNSDSIYTMLNTTFRSQAKENKNFAEFSKVMIYADNLRQYVTLVTSSNGVVIRDSSMACNLRNMILLSGQSVKVIVWSHNMHEWKTDPYMGSFLKKEFGNEYLSIGFAFDKGSYNGATQGTINVNEALPSYPGSFEYICKGISNNPFFLDLRPNKDSSNLPQIFLSPLDHHNIGLTAKKYSFASMIMPAYYDAIIYIPNSTPTRLLDFAK